MKKHLLVFGLLFLTSFTLSPTVQASTSCKWTGWTKETRLDGHFECPGFFGNQAALDALIIKVTSYKWHYLGICNPTSQFFQSCIERMTLKYENGLSTEVAKIEYPPSMRGGGSGKNYTPEIDSLKKKLEKLQKELHPEDYCPENSSYSSTVKKCYCNSGYILNKQKNGCNSIPLCPRFSEYSLTKDECVCQNGYRMNASKSMCLQNNVIEKNGVKKYNRTKRTTYYPRNYSNKTASRSSNTPSMEDLRIQASVKAFSKDYDGALAIYNQMLSRNPQNQSALYGRGHLYITVKNDLTSGCNDLQKAAKLGSEVSENYYQSKCTSLNNKGTLKITTPRSSEGIHYTNKDILPISGTVPPNTQSVKVNDFTLSLFRPGDSTFVYYANKRYFNLKEGVNNYEVIATDSKGAKTSTQIKIIKR